jgi:uncharacterized Fe-S center protein
MKGMWTAWDDD